jgi:hypothetical protein
MSRATATFVIDTFEAPAPPDGAEGETILSSALLTKTFQGDIAATSTVRMLGAQTPVDDAAAYVALERIVGSVHGRKGSFVLLHAATAEQARWQVVTGSGTDELAGLTGVAVLERHPDGGHTLTLDYELPE